MSEMVERLARVAFREAEHLDPSEEGLDADDAGWSRLTERRREFWRLLVGRIVSEMREPTESMTRCAIGAGWSGCIEGIEECEMESGGGLWKAMIDEALR